MKIFHQDKYHYIGITNLPADGKNYYTFECIKTNFSGEVVLVRSAKLVSNSGKAIYFDEEKLA